MTVDAVARLLTLFDAMADLGISADLDLYDRDNGIATALRLWASSRNLEVEVEVKWFRVRIGSGRRIVVHDMRTPATFDAWPTRCGSREAAS